MKEQDKPSRKPPIRLYESGDETLAQDLEADLADSGAVPGEEFAEHYDLEFTARDAAKALIRPYVERGDTEESLRYSRMGSYNDRYNASIGGVVRKTLPGGGDQVRGIGPEKIIVTRVMGRIIEPPAIYSLSELYDEVRRENDPNEYSQGRLF